LLLALGLVLGQFGDLGIDLRLLVLVQFDPPQPALVVNRHRRAVFDCAADVVDVDVVAEHGGCVYVVLLDWRAGETDERSVRESVPQILGEAIGNVAGFLLDLGLESVLAAVRLVSDHDDVAAVSQHRIVSRPRFRRELLQGGEDHSSRGSIEQFAKVVSIFGLLWRLAQQVLAHAEGAEQLVVQIITVGQHHQCRVLHRSVLDDLAGIERHQEALSGALGVPDNAGLGSPPGAVAASVRATAWRTAWN
jgi:hypothetical protein